MKLGLLRSGSSMLGMTIRSPLMPSYTSFCSFIIDSHLAVSLGRYPIKTFQTIGRRPLISEGIPRKARLLSIAISILRLFNIFKKLMMDSLLLSWAKSLEFAKGDKMTCWISSAINGFLAESIGGGLSDSSLRRSACIFCLSAF